MKSEEGHHPMSHSSQSHVKAGLLDTIGNTPLVSLPTLSPKPGVQIFAKLEGQNPTGSVKDRIAKSMIDAAERDGLLTREKTILEPSSVNTGISLALVSKLKGYKLKVVMPANVSLERVQLLKAYGAQVELSDGQQGTNHSIRVAEGMV